MTDTQDLPVPPHCGEHLHRAASQGDYFEVIRLVEKEGCSPLAQDGSGRTALEYAVANRDRLLVSFLAGATESAGGDVAWVPATLRRRKESPAHSFRDAFYAFLLLIAAAVAITLISQAFDALTGA